MEKRHVIRKNSGQAALIAVIFMMAIMLSAIFGVILLSLKEARVAGNNYKSRNSFFAAEAGIDDAIYRLLRGKNLSSSYAVSLNGATADINVTNVSNNTRRIISSGDASGANRALSAEIVTGTDNVNFFYGVQVGDGGLLMGNNAVVNGNIYSNGNIEGDNGAVVTGDVVVAGGISGNPSVEATTTDSNFSFATVADNRDAAQSFTANATDRLNKISVYLGKAGSPSGNITLKIAADNGGKPATGNLASATIANSSVGATPSWIDVSFSSPPNLTNGAKYWIVLDYGSSSAVNYWNWKKDSADGYADNTGRYTSDCCSGNPVWTNAGGDLNFRTWIGGVNTKIDGLTIGTSTAGTAHANLFVNTTVRGLVCPNQYCFIENPPREELPISDGVILDWKAAAAAGGTTAGDVIISGTQTIGPRKITGKLTVSNGATLIVGGTIWVVGDIVFDNLSIIKLAPEYDSFSGVILSDSKIDVKNNSVFSGSGEVGSHMMVLAAKDSIDEEIINVDNNSEGVIYYAGKGRIKFSNNGVAKEATSYGLILDNNATITYESGLANVNFSSGPAGGWDIIEWKEIIP
ncbi:hypothetical protein A2930_04425 [Candidatus Giovannonibacteria bacterium RIFCSPLOWO2_01_FULL_45_34]|uniref:Type 4 fimbrial biogenesis protein PilX N-terminal domain-containing protein n=1 Tax=Candidatus Giovannonibacteria bacterium RIFCSPLOWO2_01_FULL_45_34 TaxID=1798351 RepID=A0A1F5X1M3_9BACT|nr:MAG: hypothetical protein A2930_04425 [Candidatus Giovannonibacteria bacterium RIFCSPLOWO2_01_FULL_45_34]